MNSDYHGVSICVYIDTHSHLYDKKFSTDFPRMIQRAIESGVERIIVIGEDLETSRKVVAMANRATIFSATIGVHPHHAKTYTYDIEKFFEQTSEDPKVVAIGEVGLDYYHENSPRDLQTEVFRRQIHLARRCGLPLVLHVRDAYQDLLKIFKEEKAGEIGGVVHCFSSDYADAKAILDFGFYLGIGGPVTYGNAQVLQEVVRKVPIERILLETDAPYLAPAPKRGRRNEPSFLKYTARQIAELKKLSIQDVARITKLNALKVYRLPKRLEPQVAYPIEKCLYLNITNHCSNHCYFCHRGGDFVIKGHYLKLKEEPTVEEIKAAVGDGEVFERYEEVAFCGAGEPTLRFDVVMEIAKWLKEKGLRVRLNTNGQGNLINKRDILPEMKGLIDTLSISLNAPDARTYNKVSQPADKKGAFPAVLEFAREAKQHVPNVVMTAVAAPEVDLEACRALAEDELEIPFLVREFEPVE